MDLLFSAYLQSLLLNSDDGEIEEEEMEGVDESTEHEFSFKEFVLR